MTASDLMRLLAESNLALAAGVIVVVLARRWVRQLFGASAAYGLWLLPALAAAAVALPPRTVEIAGRLAASPGLAPPQAELPTSTLEGLSSMSGLDLATVVAWGWIAGALVMGVWLVVLQLRFMGEVKRGRAGPAVVGFLWPRIVTPTHFEDRFSRREQLVVLAHERTHLLRGDAQVNGVVALVRCVCWFNPLAHLGAHLMRVDQELACDASVIVRYPKSRAPYAQALLKAELAARPLPLGCYWPAKAVHPLTERMAMLQRDPLPRRRRLAGAVGVGVLAAVAGTAAWAARPPEVVMATTARSSTAPVPEPAGAVGRELIDDDSAATARPLAAPLPGAVAAPAPQPSTAGEPEVTQRANIAAPSADLDEERRTQSRVSVAAATPSTVQPEERPILLASLQPTAKSAALQRPPPSTADLPPWSETPDPAEMQAAYPPAAARANYAGSATLECTVAPDGGLTDCVVASERAPGFGAAALKVAPMFRLPTTGPSGASIVGRTVRPRISWVNPATAQAALVVQEDAGPVGTVTFNCRVRAQRTVDNCVAVGAMPRGRQAFDRAGLAALRFRAPATSAEFSRITVIVQVITPGMPQTNALTFSSGYQP